jgi:uncharacterized protein
MKFSEYDGSSALKITAYTDTQIFINDQPYTTSLIITRQQVFTDWAAACPADFNIETLERLLSFRPELIILGTGQKTVFPNPEIMVKCSEAGVGFEVMDSASACRTYNVLLSEERKVVAGLLMPDATDL